MTSFLQPSFSQIFLSSSFQSLLHLAYSYPLKFVYFIIVLKTLLNLLKGKDGIPCLGPANTWGLIYGSVASIFKFNARMEEGYRKVYHNTPYCPAYTRLTPEQVPRPSFQISRMLALEGFNQQSCSSRRNMQGARKDAIVL